LVVGVDRVPAQAIAEVAFGQTPQGVVPANHAGRRRTVLAFAALAARCPLTASGEAPSRPVTGPGPGFVVASVPGRAGAVAAGAGW